MIYQTGTGKNLLTHLQSIIPTRQDVLVLKNFCVHAHSIRLVEHNARKDVPLRIGLQILSNDNARSFRKGFMKN